MFPSTDELLLSLLLFAAVTAGAGSAAVNNAVPVDAPPEEATVGTDQHINIDVYLGRLLSLPSRSNLRSNLFNLTRRSHVAGTPGDYHDARYVHRQLNSLPGFASRIDKVDVMLTYPLDRPRLTAPAIGYVAKLSEDVLSTDATSGKTAWRNHTFLAYSPSGTAAAPLVYANYGRPEDFAVLDSLGISVENTIVLMRYGECFRGLKVMNAEERGAVGSIIYSDPADDGYGRGDTYPNGPYRPPSGVQRGSVQFNSKCAGDPWRLYATTATNGVCGYPTEELIPSRPVMPLSYEDALPLLSSMGGPAAPADFQGGMNLTYTVGPSSFDVSMTTNHSFLPSKIPNVIATMKGSDEEGETGPIILGNHRDAWVFGAVDPNSGTTALLEVGRCLSLLWQEGWRPKRTIILASWSGEEYGLLGSTAYAEMHEQDGVIKDAVAYLNVDIAVSGNHSLEASATHSLDQLFFDAASIIAAPDDPEKTLLDRWEGGDMGTLGSGSDYTAFLDRYGIASLDMSYKGEHGTYGTYHSVYDSFDWMTTQADPDFSIHEAMTKLWLCMAYRLAALPVLPIVVVNQANTLIKQVEDLRTAAAAAGVDLELLHVSTGKFLGAAQQIDDMAKMDVDRDTMRSINRHLALLERRFLGNGLPKRPWFKHILQAPGFYLGYGSRPFPGIAEALDDDDVALAKREIEAAAQAVDSATEFLLEAVTVYTRGNEDGAYNPKNEGVDMEVLS